MPEFGQNRLALKEAELERVTAEMVEADAKFRVMVENSFEILKAVRTGDFSEFSGVTSRATYRAYLKEKLRAALAAASARQGNVDNL